MLKFEIFKMKISTVLCFLAIFVASSHSQTDRFCDNFVPTPNDTGKQGAAFWNKTHAKRFIYLLN